MTEFMKRKLSRRNLMQGAGLGLLGAASVGLTSNVAFAQEMSNDLPVGLQSFNVGDIGVTLMQENAFALPLAAFGGGAEEGEVAALLSSRNLPTDAINASVTIPVLKMGSETIMLDTGWHGDHVGGLSNEGALNFPNATVHFPELDWNLLQEADNDNARGALAKVQPAQDAGQLELYTTGDLLSGLEAVAAPGHTPGHHAVLISSGTESLMYTADTANHHITSLIHPEWAFGFDADAAKATETRINVLDRLATDGTRMIAYHFPFPGAGFVARNSEGFVFTPGS